MTNNKQTTFNWAALSAEEQRLVLDTLEQHRKDKKRYAAMDTLEAELKAAITQYIEFGGFIAVDRDVYKNVYCVENYDDCYEINADDVICLYDWPDMNED